MCGDFLRDHLLCVLRFSHEGFTSINDIDRLAVLPPISITVLTPGPYMKLAPRAWQEISVQKEVFAQNKVLDIWNRKW
jgi:hypothetical protein